MLLHQCQLTLLQELSSNFQYLYSNSSDEFRDYTSPLSNLSDLILWTKLKQPPPTDEVGEIADESIRFAYQAVAMKDHMLGLVCDRHAPQCYLQRELGRIMSDVSEHGLNLCRQEMMNIESHDGRYATRVQIYRELYAIIKTIYREAKLAIDEIDYGDYTSERHSLYVSSLQ
jgi:hypothetical protein